uniref:uncharacterized protein LOC108950565 isoform X1 n=1 Tax=Ciona intestinalis TaxID=7719 RepID=UPI00089DCE94|nr:uncharacterized protein LOC108950565 isoform X1 [Ciona intestinalis]|eukprot:XP_018672069.1 uncharacterized protein LOC108950565 isoform X1 [Ciona intestinalis]
MRLLILLSLYALLLKCILVCFTESKDVLSETSDNREEGDETADDIVSSKKNAEIDKSSKSKCIRVLFVEDGEVRDIFRTREVRTMEHKHIRSLDDVVFGQPYKARWPYNGCFYAAEPVSLPYTPQKTTRNAESEPEEVHSSPLKLVKKRRKHL